MCGEYWVVKSRQWALRSKIDDTACGYYLMWWINYCYNSIMMQFISVTPHAQYESIRLIGYALSVWLSNWCTGVKISFETDWAVGNTNSRERHKTFLCELKKKFLFWEYYIIAVQKHIFG